MPTFAHSQAYPALYGAWWNVLEPVAGWTTESFTPSAWTVRLADGRTAVFGSASGFTAPRFPSDVAHGVVSSITLKEGGATLASVTGLDGLGLQPDQIAADPFALTRTADDFRGSTGADSFTAGVGNDVLDGGDGNDTLIGGLNNDTLSGGAGNDSLDGQGDGDLIFGHGGNDIIRAFEGEALGGDGDDNLTGYGSYLHGGGGNDTITSSSNGVVVLDGDDGDDRFQVDFAPAGSTVNGGAGFDVASIVYRGGGPITLSQVGGVNLTGIERLELSAELPVNADLSALPEGMSFRASTYNDTIRGTAAADTLEGSSGTDVIAGGAGDDILDGGSPGWGSVFYPRFSFQSFTIVYPESYDLVDYSRASAGVTIDLTREAQPTVEGTDILRGFEGVIGSAFADVLVGAPGDRKLPASETGSVDPNAPRLASKLYGEGGDDLLVGTQGGDTLVGGSGADTLEGRAGDDALDSSAGADVLTGGAGRDFFFLTLDGQADRLVDFSVAEGDYLLLRETAGPITNGATGVLTWNQMVGQLIWDADGDGAQAPILAATLGGAGALARGSFAAGFQPSAVRTITPDGGRNDLVLDWGTQAFDWARSSYSAQGALKSYETVFDDRSHSLLTRDWENVASWSTVVADYNGFEELTAYSVTHDGGARTLWQFDVAGTRSWTRVLEEYDALGRLSQQSAANDDGTAWERHIDTYDTQPWAYYIDNFRDGGLVSHTFYRADGSVFI